MAKSKRKRRSNTAILRDKILELCDGSGGNIANLTLRKELSWAESKDKEKYERAREALVNEGFIRRGGGYSGSVSVLEPAKIPCQSSQLNVFISYSHIDLELKEELLKHLLPIEKLGLVSSWDDRQITSGSDWSNEISDKLEAADIIIPLVSIDFINSNYCYETEMNRALERAGEKSAVLVPVILRNCLWQETPLAKFQALPEGAKPVVNWQSRDDALANVATGLLATARSLMGKGVD